MGAPASGVASASSSTSPSIKALWAAGLGGAATLGMLFGAQSIGLRLAKDQPPNVVAALAYAFLPWLGWAVLLPAVFSLCRRWPLRRAGLLRTWGRYFAAALVGAVLHCALITIPLGWVRPTLMGPSFLRSVDYVVVNLGTTSLVQFVMVVVACHAAIAFREIRHREVQSAELKAQLAQAELFGLKMQLQPHFLFNTLNTIAAYVRTDPSLAERMIEQLSELLRLVLGTGGDQEVPLGRELDIARNYLSIHQARFGHRLSVDIHVDEEAEDLMVPALLLQPLVENAILHGVGNHLGAGHVVVRAERRGDRLILSIENSGPGPDNEGLRVKGSGIGLLNTSNRLKQLYGSDHAFDIRAGGLGRDTVVTLDLPARALAGEMPRLEGSDQHV